ncbi:MAG: NAD-dependent epimerase/dehydratase family protein [Bacillota bacterium]
MRILIFGGGKFQGQTAAERLVELGHDVTLYNHSFNGIAGAQHIHGERNDYVATRKLISAHHYDCLIDNLAYSQQDVERLLPVMHERVGHYLLISSFVVYGHHTALGLVREEDAPLNSMEGSPYDVGKRQCELALRETNISTTWSVLRFANIDGPEDPSNRRGFFIDRVADDGGLLIPNDFIQPFRPLWRNDAAEAVVQAATAPKSRAGVYNVAGREVMTVTEWVNLLADVMSRPKPYLAALSFDEIRRLAGFDYRLPIPGRPILDTTRIESELGFRPTPVERWLPEAVQWWLESGIVSRFWETRPLEIAAIEKFRRSFGLL